MSVTLSPFALDAMGFREIVSQGAFVASFMSVTVYEARGVLVPEGFADAQLGRVAGADYRVSIAQSVNAGCRALTGDDFDESEPTWRKQVKSKGPFVLIGVGPTDFYECVEGRAMRQDDGSIITYDSFPEVSRVLGSLEKRVIPPVLAAMTCAFNESVTYVSLRKLARASAGRCVDGKQVQDVRVGIKGDLFVSQTLDDATLSGKLAAVTAKAGSLHQRAARLFALGVSEDDQLKKFLYFFLALEVETHRVFGRIDHRARVASLLAGPAALSTVKADLISTQVAALSTLLDRFIWCAACVWSNLSDKDLGLFEDLKSARDDIAHGRSSEPPAGFARSAELLAQKVLWR